MAVAKVVVSGATSQVGELLCPRLAKAGHEVHIISRQPIETFQNETFRYIVHQFQPDTHKVEPKIENVDTLIHLAPLWVLPEIMQALTDCKIQRIVAFGSTSRFTKHQSRSIKEQETVNKLIAAENKLEQYCERNQIAWTLLRPTMIYGTGKDRSITTIRNFIRRFGFFPLAGTGKGLRQPVHAEDLAWACMNVLENKSTYKRAYNLGGGEVLPFREILETIADQEGKSIYMLRLPNFILNIALRMLRLFPMYSHLDPEMFARAEQDLVFDNDDAANDFFYAPRHFRNKTGS